ncbi:MAG TPA: hypothetical protein ENH13_00625 [Euryarchaeota archaeon]|nr:hypothetical protein BMS3Abin16_01660 [archaeon BMS3Abin16]HDH27614.1 hypothetical protein [Euryarchaeota archaeon]HDY74665.1 hypothetical protein [Euryarchaeota archaeon]
MDETDEMVRLLLSGVKMLGLHCPRCGLMLFDRGGSILCVRCGEVRVVREGGDADSEVGDSDSSVKDVFERKRADLLKRLESEEDPVVIAALSDAISKLGRAMRGRGE